MPRSLDGSRFLHCLEKYGHYGSGVAAGHNLLQVTKNLDGNPLENSVPLANMNNANDFYDLGEGHEPTDTDESDLADDDFLIANPILYAYNITTKRWGELIATGLCGIPPNFHIPSTDWC